MIEGIDELAKLGAVGVMGVLWIWERRLNHAREEQIDKAHERILADHVALEQLLEVVRKNAEALTRLAASVDALGTSLGRRQSAVAQNPGGTPPAAG